MDVGVDIEISMAEDVPIASTTPSRISKRRGSPGLPTTPAKRKETGGKGGARPRDGPLSPYLVRSPTPSGTTDSPNDATNTRTNSNAAKRNATANKNRNKDKGNSQHSSSKPNKATKQRLVRRK